MGVGWGGRGNFDRVYRFGLVSEEDEDEDEEEEEEKEEKEEEDEDETTIGTAQIKSPVQKFIPRHSFKRASNSESIFQ